MNELIQKITDALSRQEWDWRTIDGLMKETGYTREEILEALRSISASIVVTKDENLGFLVTLRARFINGLNTTTLLNGSLTGFQINEEKI